MTVARRRFLQWVTAASGAAAAGCGDGSGAGPDAGAAAADAAASCAPTTGDVLGPFFEAGAPMRAMIAGPDEPGERLTVEGVVVGDDCAPIAGALLDIWQADVDGNYHTAGVEYRLRGQVLTDADGRYQIETIIPGNYQLADASWRPAHIHFMVSKPGHATLTTQLYFEGDPFLPPNDGCTTCGSDDPARIMPLQGDAAAGWTGEFRIVLLRTAR